MESCQFCGDKRCEGCPLPFVENLTLGDLMLKLGSNSNNSFYSADNYRRGKQDLIIDVVWHHSLTKEFFSKFISAKPFSGARGSSTEGENASS
jgi:hypothetical protein